MEQRTVIYHYISFYIAEILYKANLTTLHKKAISVQWLCDAHVSYFNRNCKIFNVFVFARTIK